tara:strand:- start:56 stop:295 length:240 start_codon:yes stop_codon:yes gene_type:complete
MKAMTSLFCIFIYSLNWPLVKTTSWIAFTIVCLFKFKLVVPVLVSKRLRVSGDLDFFLRSNLEGDRLDWWGYGEGAEII